jgi:hypothetical protein
VAEGDLDSAGGGEPGTLPGDEPGRGAALRGELLAALELCGLTALAFTRPVLDSFGRAPETFLVRDATPRDVVIFAVLVATVPALLAAVVGALGRIGGRRVRAGLHLALVGLLGAVVVWRFGTDITTRGRTLMPVAGVVSGAAFVALRMRIPQTGTYLRFLGAASAVFLGQFLVLSPSSSLALGDAVPATDADAADAVMAGTEGDPPPVVVLVLDSLPTVSLLDGAGNIDAGLYPNLAALAGDATWYRNHTTTSAWTWQAVPALLSGSMPREPSPLPDVENYPENLFTLFGGTHDITAVEELTRLCPTELCPPDGGNALSALVGDAVDWWRGGLEVEQGEGADMLPGALGPDRADDFLQWVRAQDFSLGGTPGMWFYHLVMPHDPWVMLDDMTPYEVVREEPYGLFYHGLWRDVGADVAHQRHILQLQGVDRAVGELLDELRADGAYDESAVVVIGDHGEAIGPTLRMRGATEDQYEQIGWTPLIVKAPGQTEAIVDDANVWNVDLVPTIADVLGIELPWEVDGVPAARADEEREPDDKRMLDSELHLLEPIEDSAFVALDGIVGFDRVLGTDPVAGTGEHAVWQRTDHGALVGRAIDDLVVGHDGVGTLTVDGLDRIEDPDGGPPVLEFLASCRLEPGQVVAITVNDVVAAVAPVQLVAVGAPEGERVVHALLMPDSFADSNDVTGYLVAGAPGAETLHPLTLIAG